MADKLHGNRKGLAPSQIRMAERLYRRRLASNELVTLEFARELYSVASELRRRVGVLVSREGKIIDVFLGTKEILYLPDLGRYRLGAGRLRRLRLVYSDLSSKTDPQIPSDIYADLEKLRLDAVIGVKAYDNRVAARYAFLLPYQGEQYPTTQSDLVTDLGLLKLDFADFITELETEIDNSNLAKEIADPNRAVLVGVYDKRLSDAEYRMQELIELARTAGINIADTIIQRRTPDPKTLLGKGKLEELILHCLRLGVELLIFDTELKPTQWRIITNATDLKILDRSMLILDIFAQRASSSEGRLQVELAQLKYNLPRLVEKDVGLSRLTGGIGGRGPGETKLEIGRRRSRDRIKLLEKRIEKLSKQRKQQRGRRVQSGTPLVAVLGYTNVGKSTLFNKLTESKILAEDKLFATLEPAQRKLFLEQIDNNGSSGFQVVLTDTVGFIRDLPEELRNAFRATLEELYEASLLLHVVDGNDTRCKESYQAVKSVLADMNLLNSPQVTVVNKTDLLNQEEVDLICKEFEGAIPVSAVLGTGLSELRSAITSSLVLR